MVDVDGQRRRAQRAHGVVVLFPTSAAAVATLVALATWHRLPDVMVTHWGAGGADGWMPRAWAVGIPLGMTLSCATWCAAHALRHRRSPAATVDTVVVGGVFAWIGALGLVASIWLGANAHVAALLVGLCPVAAGFAVYRHAGRAGLERRAVP